VFPFPKLGNGNKNGNKNAAIGAALLCGMASPMTLMKRKNADGFMISILIRANPQNPPDPCFHSRSREMEMKIEIKMKMWR
jgi:hypothetical protein